MERETTHSLAQHAKDPSETCADTPLAIFYLYGGVLRSSIVQDRAKRKGVGPGNYPPNPKRDPEMTSRPNPESE